MKRLTKAGLVDKRYKNGRNPNSHIPKPNAGRKRKYDGPKVSLMLYTTVELASRLKAEAERRGVSRNEMFNDWLRGLPEANL